MVSRIPPPDPESNRLSQAKKLEEAQKIAKIREIDADEQAKRQSFQRSMQSAPEEEEPISSSQQKIRPQPSPLQPSFHQQKNQATSNLNLNKLPSPNYSPPPDFREPALESEDLSSTKDLPQSKGFWNDIDLPDQPIKQKTELTPQQNTAPPTPQPSKKTPTPEQVPSESKTTSHLPSKKELEPSPFGPPGKPVLKKETAVKEPSPFEPKATKKNTSENAHEELEIDLEPDSEQEASMILEEEERQRELPSTPNSRAKRPADKKLNDTSKEFAAFFHKPIAEEKEERQGKRELKTTIEILPPSLPGFSATIHPEAVSATTAAAPYLRPEAIPLFYQMVGTVFVMANQGISTTEILLNNPAFAGSKFFGSSIEIVKYSSAPDSLNIRLSGSNEAVTAFNQNIPGLMAAFQTGGFNFRIGRIDAAYAADRPIFRRKGEKNDTFDGQSEREGQ